jgi:hypothetical protein
VPFVCVLRLFCSLVVQGNIPDVAGQVSRFDVPALTFLAHIELDGQYFDDIKQDEIIYYFDKEWAAYQVKEIIVAEASDPYSKYTYLLIHDLWRPPIETYMLIYGQAGKLILQTCVERHGNYSWGRLFVIAEPIE